MIRRAATSNSSIVKTPFDAVDRDTFLASVLINLLSLCMPLAMMQIFNRVIPFGSTGTLLGIFLVLIIYIVVETVLKLSRLRILNTASIRAEARTAEQSVKGLFQIRLADLTKHGEDDVAERLGHLPDVGRLNSGALMVARIDLMFSVAFVIVIFALAPLLAVVSLLCIFTVAAWSIRTRRKFRDASQTLRVNETRRGSFLSEVFRLTPEVKLLGIEQVLLRRYEMLQQSASHASETLIRINASAATLAAIVGQLATGLVSVVGAYLVIGNHIGLAELAAAILLTGRTVQPIIQAFMVEMDMAVLRHADAQLQELAAEPQNIEATTDASTWTDLPVTPVRFEGLTLVEPWTGATLLDQMNLTLPAPGLTVIDGRSDAPTNLLLRVIAGEVRPDRGRITFGSSNTIPSDRIVFTGQDRDLDDGSVIKNLVAFRGRSLEAEPLRIGRDLGLDQDVRLLPDGYEHVINQDIRCHGSQGLYCKIRLSRALAIPADIYLLDRPFDGMDTGAQKRLLQTLQRMRKDAMIVVTSPPPSLVLDADLRLQLRPDLPLRIELGRSGFGLEKALQSLPSRVRL